MIALASLSNSVFAATDAATPTTDILSMVLSLGMVVVLILVLAFFVKKLNPNLTNNDEFKVIRSLPLGSRERLMVVEIDNAQHLLGVTPHSINYLHKLETPLTEKELPELAKRFGKMLNPQLNQNKKN
ncbi:MAG: flagellar protein FliO/FliZ [Pseudoalteromonas tetraodonis]|jgi:flagellar protein FliO/FliZ|uniref:flagellar biosynthetic protein FliO n=1 Tax=Pseudoalteromonas TaxID=53246 RepID=UPI0002D99555|nr:MULTISPECIES: flagellar biosynthetic protein FliO [Pseudoalteromonas]MDN3404653.1 flagellar biosynthetic protein FliO [Pseudoalteromonas sp. APC 3218]MDN3408449.1 flagellar biosynthetic protein FliO [Pseudoalteromonas sp. APC 3894]MDN3415126.1 flagellar biosynthetic protein FliO [Pseudoalteromonas sp. APC 3227]MDN3418824.1 flagellar biosynthetic protein FliO [Pseudoalteromonas sp. APC 3895]MDN3423156.1 flagellar biosynthetic protein FliO [Pseudoalteromonas sp. APC 3896]|tara:strand:+ start:402 stop:785 length:384 start_codon:yes stop_codon:yes gene_type:complete